MEPPRGVQGAKEAGAASAGAAVEQQPSKGGRLTNFSLSFFFTSVKDYLVNIRVVWFSTATYSQDKMRLAYRLADPSDKQAFRAVVQELAKRSKAEVATIQKSLESQTIVDEISTMDHEQKTLLIRYPEILSLTQRMENLFPLPEKFLTRGLFFDDDSIAENRDSLRFVDEFLTIIEKMPKEQFFVGPEAAIVSEMEVFKKIDSKIFNGFYTICKQIEGQRHVKNPQLFIDDHLQLLMRGEAWHRNTVLNFDGSTEEQGEEPSYQCNFPSDLQNDQEIIDPEIAKFEVIITDPKTKETRQFSLRLPSPPCSGRMRAPQVKQVLEILHMIYYPNTSPQKIKDQIEAYFVSEADPHVRKEKIEAIYNACSHFCKTSFDQVFQTLVDLKQSGMGEMDPLLAQFREELKQPNANPRQLIESTSTPSLFRLPATKERAINFSLLPPSAHASLQPYATISKAMVDVAANQLKDGVKRREIPLFVSAPASTFEAIQPPPDSRSISNLELSRKVIGRDKGDLLEITMQVNHYKGQDSNKQSRYVPYTYKKNHTLLSLTKEEMAAIGNNPEAIKEARVQKTLNHIQTNESLQRNLLEGVASFRRQIAASDQSLAYGQVQFPKESNFLTTTPEKQASIYVTAMKLGKVTNHSLLPPLQKGLRLPFDFKHLTETVPRRLAELREDFWNTSITMPFFSGFGMQTIEFPARFNFSEKTTNGVRYLFINVELKVGGRTHTYPLRYTFATPEQTRKELMEQLNKERILEDDLLKMLSYAMRLGA